MTLPLPDKDFFKIGEAAEIVGVKAHVLRYWESEFPSIRPLKTRGAHRMYRRADVEMLCTIHKLLHQQGYTIAGARKRVRELRSERGEQEEGVDEERSELHASHDAATRELGLRAELIQVRNDLAALLVRLDEREKPQSAVETASVTVTAVVAKTVLLPQRKLPR